VRRVDGEDESASMVGAAAANVIETARENLVTKALKTQIKELTKQQTSEMKECALQRDAALLRAREAEQRITTLQLEIKSEVGVIGDKYDHQLQQYRKRALYFHKRALYNTTPLSKKS